MRASIVADGLGALVVAAVVVAYFSPIRSSFWGNTFFGIPYGVAVVAVPLAAAGCAAVACWFSHRRLNLANRGATERGIAIGVIAFLLFSIFHGVTSAFFALLDGGGLLGAVTLITVPLATAFFGGLVIMPICCVVAVACEFLAAKIAA